MTDARERIIARKSELDALRPLHPDLLPALRKHFDVELTYTSNAIEGNTLSLRETAEVIEHGITVGGKMLRDHLEAADHYDAIQWMRSQAANLIAVTENTVTELHRLIVMRSAPEIAGQYSRLPRRIAGSAVVFPNPAKIPHLMKNLGATLETIGDSPTEAFDAHYSLVAIHPFADGNGRTARLLMNLILLRSGYPPIAIRPEDRREYLAALEHASLHQDVAQFQNFLHGRLADTMDAYVGLFREASEEVDVGPTSQIRADNGPGR